ncbi:MAG: hypothetical protein Q7S21_04325 [archaeon]|nr:hypothetical protein [archaeon]
MNKLNTNAQGALEYLLLIGGGVMIAAVVIALLAGLGTTGQTQSEAGGDSINSSFDALQAGLFPPTGGAVCDGVALEPGEACDGAFFAPPYQNGECTDNPIYDGGTLSCVSCAVDTSSCILAPSCNDVIQNQGETYIDCGGPNCSACADNLSCINASDCQSGVCTGNICQPASCGDGVINGSEVCDGLLLNGETCATQGFGGGGALSCNSSGANQCQFNIAACIPAKVQTFIATVTPNDSTMVNLFWVNPATNTNPNIQIVIRESRVPSSYPPSPITGTASCNVNYQSTTCIDGPLIPDGTFRYAAFSVNGDPNNNNGAVCINASDCQSGVCTGGICRARDSGSTTLSTVIDADGIVQTYPPLSPMLSPNVTPTATPGSGSVTLNYSTLCYIDDPAQTHTATCAANFIANYRIYYTQSNTAPLALSDYASFINNVPFIGTYIVGPPNTPALTAGQKYYFWVTAVSTIMSGRFESYSYNSINALSATPT